ncbi:MAG: c-type cytochrome [Pseudomonadota bacterium]|nr:c-type cytochrome [Pseudomonadota bacterium]
MPAKKSLAMLLGSVLMFGSTQLMAAPTASMLADTCAGCHGPDGSSMGPAIPNIAGVSAEYFNTVMKEYAEDDRASTIMGRIARGYTTEEIALMADFYAAKKLKSTTQKLDTAKVDAGSKLYKKNCSKCHDEFGALADDDSGILAGQWLPYLHYSMEDFQAGNREMPKKMKKKIKKLSAAEIETLLQFFASQQ